MHVVHDSSPSPDTFKKQLTLLSDKADIRLIVALACDANGFAPEQIDPILKAQKTSLIGGVFPQLIIENQRLETGFILIGLAQEAQIKIVRGLSDQDLDYESELEDADIDISNTGTTLVFVDGLARRISALVESLFNVFGLETNYIGGGAGSLSFEQRPCLFTNEGFLGDSAAIAFTGMESGIGVAHGWTELVGPLKVTESQGNRIISLDWKPAYQVYRDAVEANGQVRFSESDFFEVAKSHPFGISKLGAEKVVRDPISTDDDGAITCVGEVPQNAFVHILTGNHDSLVNAAALALQRASEAKGSNAESPGTLTLLVDCISRFLFLGDEFHRELDAATRDKHIPVIGMLTLGEIANSRKDYLEFYNKTSVVGILDT